MLRCKHPPLQLRHAADRHTLECPPSSPAGQRETHRERERETRDRSTDRNTQRKTGDTETEADQVEGQCSILDRGDRDTWGNAEVDGDTQRQT